MRHLRHQLPVGPQMTTNDEFLYFGVWNQPGHYMHLPGGRTRHYHPAEHHASYHIDGSLAPRETTPGTITFVSAARGTVERQRIQYCSEELPQGAFLLHKLDNGYTAIQWWDRSQGDRRGASNSTFLWRGDHSAEEMVAALAVQFPSVMRNLQSAAIELYEVKAT